MRPIKGDKPYNPWFWQICKILGLNGIDLFSPSDVVEKKNIRKVCICLRALSNKARSKQLKVKIYLQTFFISFFYPVTQFTYFWIASASLAGYYVLWVAVELLYFLYFCYKPVYMPQVPDFDLVTSTVVMPKNMVGGIRRSLETSQGSLSSSSGYYSYKETRSKLTEVC